MNPIDVNNIELDPIDTNNIELDPIDTNNIELDSEDDASSNDNLLLDARDLSLGAVQGLSFGGADELTGAIKAAYAKLNPSTTEEEASTFADLYRKKQQESQKSFEEASERSPWLYGAGQIAGGVTSGAVTGGLLGLGGASVGAVRAAAPALTSSQRLLALGGRGLSTYKTALPVILGESALSSKEGGITSIEEAKQLGKDVLGGAAFALPATIGLQGVAEGAKFGASKLKGMISNVVDDTPLLRQMKVSYGYGTQGINPKSQSSSLSTDLNKLSVTGLDDARTYKLRQEITDTQKTLGKGISSSLENSKNLINIDPQIKETLNNIEGVVARFPDVQENARAQQIFKRIAEGETKISAIDAKGILDDIDTYIKKFRGAKTLTRAEEDVLGTLLTARKSFSNTLKLQVPEYQQANTRFAEFMKLVPESLVGNTIFDETGKPVQISRKFFGEMHDTDKKLFDDIKQLVQGATREGSATHPIRERFVNTIKGLKTFEQQEADRLLRGEIDYPVFSRAPEIIEQEIKSFSDDAVARSAMDALSPHTGVATTFSKVLTGTGETGRAMSLSSANIAGRISNKIGKSGQNNPISKVVSSIYRAPQETTLALSQKLKSVPGLEKYGKSLEEALNSPDSNRRNQVLFTIMQNPQARLFVNEETNDFSEEQP